MKIFKQLIESCNRKRVLDEVVEIHLQSDFHQPAMTNEEFRDHVEELRDGYAHVLDTVTSYGEWTWFRKKYSLCFARYGGDDDQFNPEPYIDVHLVNKNYEEPPEGAKAWGGKHNVKDDAPDGHYNCNYDNFNKHFSCGMMPWRILVNLDFTVDDTLIADYEDGVVIIEQLIAEFLYEITFHGFEENSYKELKSQLKQQMDDIESGKEKLIPWEDVKKDIKDWIEDRSVDEPESDGEYNIKISNTAVNQFKDIITDDDVLNDCETD
jgi:hypothetical protein